MLTGIFVVITLIPFQIFFTLWGFLFSSLGLDVTIVEPQNFGNSMVSFFQKAYVFDYIFPTASFIRTIVLSINLFIALGIWTLCVWIYKRVRGA